MSRDQTLKERLLDLWIDGFSSRRQMGPVPIFSESLETEASTVAFALRRRPAIPASLIEMEVPPAKNLRKMLPHAGEVPETLQRDTHMGKGKTRPDVEIGTDV